MPFLLRPGLSMFLGSQPHSDWANNVPTDDVTYRLTQSLTGMILLEASFPASCRANLAYRLLQAMPQASHNAGSDAPCVRGSRPLIHHAHSPWQATKAQRLLLVLASTPDVGTRTHPPVAS
jgi:hypothetical protein